MDSGDSEMVSRLTVTLAGSPVILSASPSALVVEQNGKLKAKYTWWNVLWAESYETRVTLSLIEYHKEASKLVSFTATVSEAERAAALLFTQYVMENAYKDTKPRRRLRIFVNPVGGKGKGTSIYLERVKPIFEAAHCGIDTTITERAHHALEITRDMPLNADCIVVLSGDGLLHEVINGLAERPDAEEALATMPLAPIPTGSANGTCVNLLGKIDGFDVAMACVNAIKGRPMKLDLCLVTQKSSRTWSFMSQAMGLMADVDLGTEHLRWMGDARFMVGFLRELWALKRCPVTMEIKVVAEDKEQMVQQWKSTRSSGERTRATNGVLGKPPSTSEWVTLDKPILYFYAGKMPYVARDLMQFPLSVPGDGTIDLAIQEVTSRWTLLKAIDGADRGQQIYIPSQRYYKVEAYRVTPLVDDANVSIDGEKYPCEPFEVQVRKGMANIMSPSGSFVTDFSGINEKWK
ncbi:hypothetical protein SISNIDRAFT_546021 [Sistotremastrum niveocremeum HHB9708]|uniref:DAGKc domain-containing protein n=1 Tax=Sistotremastrum niveocremeum HHB9708 TaxID=1314777 RepID=A0A165ALH8_9AGAM|nr:hypothetical protein SISNIDRAFT_546021 [Sistotremastrum niveocremeum HHB9708]